MYDIKMLKAKKLAELIEIAEQIGLKDIKGMKKQDLIDAITKNPDQETSSVNTKPQLEENKQNNFEKRPRNGSNNCLLYTSPSPRDTIRSRMPSSA